MFFVHMASTLMQTFKNILTDVFYSNKVLPFKFILTTRRKECLKLHKNEQIQKCKNLYGCIIFYPCRRPSVSHGGPSCQKHWCWPLWRARVSPSKSSKKTKTKKQTGDEKKHQGTLQHQPAYLPFTINVATYIHCMQCLHIRYTSSVTLS